MSYDKNVKRMTSKHVMFTCVFVLIHLYQIKTVLPYDCESVRQQVNTAVNNRSVKDATILS